MLLAQGRYWRATRVRGPASVALEIVKGSLPEELSELRELRIDVPLEKWNRVVKNVQSDRKLLGGLLLDHAKHKDRVSAAIGSDRLLFELQRVVLDATVALIDDGALVLTAGETGDE